MSEREKLTSSSPLVFKRWRVANGTVGERFFEGIITDIEAAAKQWEISHQAQENKS